MVGFHINGDVMRKRNSDGRVFSVPKGPGISVEGVGYWVGSFKAIDSNSPTRSTDLGCSYVSQQEKDARRLAKHDEEFKDYSREIYQIGGQLNTGV